MKRFMVLGALAGALFLSGCVASSQVTFNVQNTKGQPVSAKVFVDGEMIGDSPAVTKMSNGVWNDPEIRVTKDGFRPYRSGVVKEAKVANVVIGFIIWPAWLWCYGPKKQQYVILEDN